jgi:hypothetical protein
VRLLERKMVKIPIMAFLALVLTARAVAAGDVKAGVISGREIYPRDRVSVISPAYCSTISGSTTLSLCAPGLKTATAHCWRQGAGFGADSTVGTVTLDGSGYGSIDFPADDYPHGPITVVIEGANGLTRDDCYLQLYNRGGVSWHEGIPRDPAPEAKGMALVFADDFQGPLSISSLDPKAAYYDHKPGGGDFSSLPFTGFDSPNNPFSQVDTYLRIRADQNTRSSGLISSLKNDGSGVRVSAPCYFECRFIAPDAKGTWPAFWIMTETLNAKVAPPPGQGPDELDIMEGYGGEGPHEPNADGKYMITSHFWNQGAAGDAQRGVYQAVPLKRYGGKSTWAQTFHTYGCKVTLVDTIYYCDDIEVGRHPTGAISKQYPFYFLIDLATGGGWPVDLSRYGGLADMYIDYVRVYAGASRVP